VPAQVVAALQPWAQDLAAAPGTPALMAAVAVAAKWKEPVLPLARLLASARSWVTQKATAMEWG
jgi:hypothetical protein